MSDSITHLRHRPADERLVIRELRQIAGQAFSRAAGADLVGGNRIRLLKNARENYPAWLDAIRAATRHVHFECYIIHEDEEGRRFANALMAKAAEGVPVRLIYDWAGGPRQCVPAVLERTSIRRSPGAML